MLHLAQVHHKGKSAHSSAHLVSIFLGKRILPVSVIVFIGLGAWYYLPDLLLSQPFGLHYIRQTDSLAFVEYFSLGKGNLLQPGTLDLNTGPDEGRTAGEFPIMYWLASVIDQACGRSTNSLRLLNFLLVVVGHAFFVQGVFKLTGRALLALGIGCCLWGSSVVAYYSCNFLPDAAAYGLALAGWGVFISTIASNGPQLNFPVAIALTLAGLIKATASMHLIAIGATCLFLSSRKPGLSLRDWKRSAIMLALGLATIATWHFWVIQYNSLHQAKYFLTSAAPIWSLSDERIAIIIDLIVRHWWTDYLHPSMWHALAIILLVALIRFRHVSEAVMTGIVLMSAGSTAFLLLFFEKFADHDYYALHMMPLVGLLLLGGGQAILSYNRAWVTTGLLMGLWGLAIASISLAHHDLGRRNRSKPDSYSRTGQLLMEYDESREALPTSAKVVVLGDNTPNGALSRIRRQGWSFPGYPLPKAPDLQDLIRQGATHVLVLSPESAPDVPMKELVNSPGYSLWEITR